VCVVACVCDAPVYVPCAERRTAGRAQPRHSHAGGKLLQQCLEREGHDVLGPACVILMVVEVT